MFPEKPKRFARTLVTWFRANQRDLPWRHTRDPYAIHVSEIMLQQTQVKTVIPYWERWMRELPNIETLATASPEKVLKLWEGLGYYSRARNLQRAAQQIVSKHDGKFPTDPTQILELAGIGRYTAGAIASIAFGRPQPIVDGNVARVLARFLGIRGDPKSKETSAAFWTAAAQLVQSTRNCSDLNQGLMELGATICTPRQPNCPACPLKKDCYARQRNIIDRLPEIAPRQPATARIFRAELSRQKGHIFLRKRPENVVNSGFWEMPNFEVAAPARRGVLCRIKHTITRYKMTLEVVELERHKGGGQWVDLNQISRLPLVSSHRKAFEAMGLLPPSKTNPAKNPIDLPQRCASLGYQM